MSDEISYRRPAATGKSEEALNAPPRGRRIVRLNLAVIARLLSNAGRDVSSDGPSDLRVLEWQPSPHAPGVIDMIVDSSAFAVEGDLEEVAILFEDRTGLLDTTLQEVVSEARALADALDDLGTDQWRAIAAVPRHMADVIEELASQVAELRKERPE